MSETLTYAKIADAAAGTGELQLDQIPLRQLVDVLNEEFELELSRRRSERQVAEIAEADDNGLRFVRGLLLASAIGITIWGGILALLIALA